MADKTDDDNFFDMRSPSRRPAPYRHPSPSPPPSPTPNVARTGDDPAAKSTDEAVPTVPTLAPQKQLFAPGALVWFYDEEPEVMWPGRIEKRIDNDEAYRIYAFGFFRTYRVPSTVWILPYNCDESERFWAIISDNDGPRRQQQLRTTVERAAAEAVTPSVSEPEPLAGAPSKRARRWAEKTGSLSTQTADDPVGEGGRPRRSGPQRARGGGNVTTNRQRNAAGQTADEPTRPSRVHVENGNADADASPLSPSGSTADAPHTMLQQDGDLQSRPGGDAETVKPSQTVQARPPVDDVDAEQALPRPDLDDVPTLPRPASILSFLAGKPPASLSGTWRSPDSTRVPSRVSPAGSALSSNAFVLSPPASNATVPRNATDVPRLGAPVDPFAERTYYNSLLEVGLNRLNQAVKARRETAALVRLHVTASAAGTASQDRRLPAEVPESAAYTLAGIAASLFAIRPWEQPASEHERFLALARKIHEEEVEHIARIVAMGAEDLHGLLSESRESHSL